MSVIVYLRRSLFLGCLLAAFNVPAAIIVNLGEGGESWAGAIGDGRVAPSSNPIATDEAQAFYGGEVSAHGLDGFAGVQSVLTPDVSGVADASGNQHDALVMSWDNSVQASQNTLLVAAWDFTFQQPGGADLSTGSSKIHFSLNAPPGVWDVSLELFDAFGNVRAWFLSMPPVDWTDYWVSVNDLSLQGFDVFLQLGDFDSSKVVGIRLNESALVSAVFPVNPVGGPIFWNAWNHLRVEVPSPAGWLLMLPGVLMLRGKWVVRSTRVID